MGPKLITTRTQEICKPTTTFWKAWAIRRWKLARFNCSMMRKARRIVTQVIPAEPRIAISSILPPFDSYGAVEEAQKEFIIISSKFWKSHEHCTAKYSCLVNCIDIEIHPFVFRKRHRRWILWLSDAWAHAGPAEFRQSRAQVTFIDLTVLVYAAPLS